MNFFELVAKRRTIRQFTAEDVSREQIEKVITAGLMAPTPNNSMPWKVFVIKNKELHKKMKDSVHKRLDELFAKVSSEKQSKLEKVKKFSTIFADAPVVLAVTAKPYQAVIDEVLKETDVSHEQMNEWRRHPDIQAAGALVQNILLAATDLGLASCWISGALVAGEQLNKLIKGGDHRLVTLIALGHPAARPAAKAPADLTDLVAWVE